MNPHPYKLCVNRLCQMAKRLVGASLRWTGLISLIAALCKQPQLYVRNLGTHWGRVCQYTLNPLSSQTLASQFVLAYK